MNFLSKIASQEAFEVASKMKELAGLLLNKNNIKVALNAQPDTMSGLENRTESFLENLKATSSSCDSVTSLPFEPKSVNQHYIVPFPGKGLSAAYLCRFFQKVEFLFLIRHFF